MKNDDLRNRKNKNENQDGNYTNGYSQANNSGYYNNRGKRTNYNGRYSNQGNSSFYGNNQDGSHVSDYSQANNSGYYNNQGKRTSYNGNYSNQSDGSFYGNNRYMKSKGRGLSKSSSQINLKKGKRFWEEDSQRVLTRAKSIVGIGEISNITDSESMSELESTLHNIKNNYDKDQVVQEIAGLLFYLVKETKIIWFNEFMKLSKSFGDEGIEFDIDTKNHEGKTVLMVALERAREDVTDLEIIKEKDRKNKGRKILNTKNLENLEDQEEEISEEEITEEERERIREKLSNGKASVVKMLLTEGASIDETDSLGRGVLWYARNIGKNIDNLFRDKKDKNGNTIYDYKSSNDEVKEQDKEAEEELILDKELKNLAMNEVVVEVVNEYEMEKTMILDEKDEDKINGTVVRQDLIEEVADGVYKFKLTIQEKKEKVQLELKKEEEITEDDVKKVEEDISLLSKCVEAGYFDIFLKLVIELKIRGVNLLKEESECTVLDYLACYVDNCPVECLEQFIGEKDKEGHTILKYLMDRHYQNIGDKKLMQKIGKLLDKGADIKEVDTYGASILMHAIMAKDVELMSKLFGDKSKDEISEMIEHKDKLDNDVLSYIIEYDDRGIAKCFCECVYDNYDSALEDLLRFAIAEKKVGLINGIVDCWDYGMVISFFEGTADENTSKTWFMCLADIDTNLVDKLKGGRNLNECKDDDGVDMLMIAVGSDNRNCCKYFMDNGVSISNVDVNRNTALTYAALGNKLKSMEYLVSVGADINHRTDVGRTALMIAVGHGYKDMYEYLVDHGADINQVDNYKNTALMLASKEQDKDAILYLIEKGADTGLKNRDGKTFWDYVDGNLKIELQDLLGQRHKVVVLEETMKRTKNLQYKNIKNILLKKVTNVNIGIK